MRLRHASFIPLVPTSWGLLALLGLVLSTGCQPPPPAPEGLNDAVRFMLREFYEDDATIAAGLTGLKNWYDSEGYSLVGEGANADEGVDAFQLEDIDATDIDLLHIPDDGRDLSAVSGVVSLSDMACDWKEAEALLVRPDQDVVFEGDFDSYSRTYVSSRGNYETGTADEDFPAVLTPLPDLFESDGSLGALSNSILITESEVQSTEFTYTLSYQLKLHFRHGLYNVQGEEVPVFIILAVLPEPANDGPSHFAQSYSVEVNYGLGDRTLRIFGVWSQVYSEDIPLDEDILDITAVNKSQAAAERLSEICAGDIVIPSES
ncbi:MAG: hypothetical protein CL928_01595 [Deltaproteobacteria bacterium]|nr:hypothetical protein [Deltaproteobacteria bacterium]